MFAVLFLDFFWFLIKKLFYGFKFFMFFYVFLCLFCLNDFLTFKYHRLSQWSRGINTKWSSGFLLIISNNLSNKLKITLFNSNQMAIKCQPQNYIANKFTWDLVSFEIVILLKSILLFLILAKRFSMSVCCFIKSIPLNKPQTNWIILPHHCTDAFPIWVFLSNEKAAQSFHLTSFRFHWLLQVNLDKSMPSFASDSPLTWLELRY